MDQTPEQLLDLLFAATLKELLRRINNDEASASDLAVAAKMLKDNNITADINKNDALKKLRDDLARRQQKNIDGRQQRGASSLLPITDADKQAAIDAFGKMVN